MTVPVRFSLALTLGLSILPRAFGGATDAVPPEPVPLTLNLTNQQIAETIAARLRQSGMLQHYDIDVRYRDG